MFKEINIYDYIFGYPFHISRSVLFYWDIWGLMTNFRILIRLNGNFVLSFDWQLLRMAKSE